MCIQDDFRQEKKTIECQLCWERVRIFKGASCTKIIKRLKISFFKLIVSQINQILSVITHLSNVLYSNVPTVGDRLHLSHVRHLLGQGWEGVLAALLYSVRILHDSFVMLPIILDIVGFLHINLVFYFLYGI